MVTHALDVGGTVDVHCEGMQTAHYQIAVVNKEPSKTSTHTGYDIFRGKRDSAWGWSKLISLSKLHDASQGWVDSEGRITLQVGATLPASAPPTQLPPH